ncbi:hypothetical protein CAter282_0593 [Collimonas arenae]|uniref:Uncharacterized protein n=1 Tax=Collimonas arenae TaxID=279058 RepID=A0A127PL51_9BURK|nr:hypothetical protein CAter10_0632 [Collimonas arenae]AMP08402.1 hypothetical protein CAter282_0593 [Collimonas arenae]
MRSGGLGICFKKYMEYIDRRPNALGVKRFDGIAAMFKIFCILFFLAI